MLAPGNVKKSKEAKLFRQPDKREIAGRNGKGGV